MVNNSQLYKIKSLFLDCFQSDDQSKIVEDSVDNNGKRFHMERSVLGHHSLDYVIYRFDPSRTDLFPYFADIRHMKKICDYVIFIENDEEIFVLLFELKRGSSSSPKRQLEMSESFFQFVFKRAALAGVEIEKEIQIRKIGITDSFTTKMETMFHKNFHYDDSCYTLIQSKSDLRLAYLTKAPIY
jgi:hypothetical protein